MSAIVLLLILASVPLAFEKNGRGGPPTAPEGSAVIAGRVTVAGVPLSLVRRGRVTLESDVLAEPRIENTDTDGRYRFERLPAGTYHVRADKPGFVTLAYGARHAMDPGSPIELKTGQTATADIALTRGAAIEGRVVDEEGEPVANLIVSASRLGYGPYGRRPVAVRQDVTDDLGRFRVHSLPAGDYYVEAAPDPMRALTQREAPGPRPPGLARTYYPGTANAGEARQVTLAVGRDVSGVDFVIATVPLARVSGRILASSGNAATATMRMQALGAPPDEVRGSLLPSDNTFTFRAVPPGDYWLMASALPAAGADPEFAAMRLTVSGGADVTNLTLTTARGATIEGRIDIEGGAAGPPVSAVRVVATPAEFELPNPNPTGAPSVPRAPVAANGAFMFSSLFGPRIFRITGLPDGWALTNVWLGDRDIIDAATDFRVTAGAVPLRIVITGAAGRLSGTVRTARNRAAARVRVVVFPEDTHQWTTQSRFIATALTAPDGTFAFGSLLPGNYLVCALEYLDENAWTDPDVLRQLRAIASPLSIAKHDKQTVTLTLRELL
jgi:protocatechuate 3,4-dioxygenase beta subunit